jgi:uncharacterized radical SAM protein YgiQ
MHRPDSQHSDPNLWLPITTDEIEKRGWEQPDVIIVSGDAYVDHPSFGPAVIGRLIESCGYRVAILPQPNWRDDLRDFKKLGKPRLFFGVTAGNMDSMVNHYTAGKRLRSDDAYTPGGVAGFRPDNASVVYSHILKNLFPDVTVLIGGVEASMRRITYYDYWADAVRPSILIESKSDLLVYGMAEKAVRNLLQRLEAGTSLRDIHDLEQSVCLLPSKAAIPETESKKTIELPPHQALMKDKVLFAKTFRMWEEELNRTEPARFIQQNAEGWLVINPPSALATTAELDAIYHLPFTRLPHPKYKKRGTVPAFEMIRDSVTMHRGCFGGCSFCAIFAHQGKFVSSRSQESVIQEVEKITTTPGFKGHITDLGGPTANMYGMAGINKEQCRKCKRPSCVYPSVCPNLNTDHKPMIEIYRKVRANPQVKKVTVGSGIRYDLFMDHPEKTAHERGHREYFRELVQHHVSGRLKVAPEHTSESVLKLMRKPSFKKFEQLKKDFDKLCAQQNLRQQLIPYFISSHPGSRPEDMKSLAGQTRDMGFRLEQVQDFTPTPGTIATVMFYTGLDPYTLKPVAVAKTRQEKEAQREFFFWYKQTSASRKETARKNPRLKNSRKTGKNPF